VAIQIAKANHTTVLSTDDESKSGKVERIDETGAVKEEGRIASAETTSAPPAAAVQAPPAPAPVREAPAPAPRTLPRTASNLSVLALLSALFLVGGLSAGVARRRV